MKIDKEILKQAMEEVLEEDIRRMGENCTGEDMDRQIEESMQKMDWEALYEKAQKDRKHPMLWWPKAAAVLLLVLAAGSVTVYAIEKVHQAGVKWEVRQGRSEDDFVFEADNPQETAFPENMQAEVPAQIKRRYQPSYIPEGFQESGNDRQEQSYHITYEKDGGILHFYQLTQTAKTMQDLDLTEKENITVNGYAGETGCRENQKVLQFVTEQYVFRLLTEEPVEWDEMFRMAESLSKMAPDVIEVYYEPVYLPEGYEEWEKEDSEIDETVTDMIFVKKEKDSVIASISFSQAVLDASVSIDSEDMKRETVEINGWQGQLDYKKDKKSVIWATNEYVFSVHANGEIGREELLKIAKGVTAKP